MNLVMFDMDGTLTDSESLDTNCYILAIEQVLGVGPIIADWESFIHASSSYCLVEIVRRCRGDAPTPAESRAVQSRMIELMDGVHRRRGSGMPEIAGAAACIGALRNAGHAVAIATGDWESTARHKLASARIPFENLPAAFCDCSHIRTDIMRASHSLATAHYRRHDFDRVVYVGDGSWDVRACREIGWPLVGIGREHFGQRLRSLGTSHVLPDFTDQAAFLAAVAEATIPSGPRS